MIAPHAELADLDGKVSRSAQSAPEPARAPARGARARQIHAHTGLRGLAALGVVCVHVPSPVSGGSLFPRGYLLVDLFFLLSGFVMAYTYRGRFAGEGRWRQACRFWEARFARIYPLHATVLAVMALGAIGFAVLQSRVGARSPFVWPLDWALLRELLLLNNWSADPMALGWNFPSWSIAAEAHVYLLCPLLLWLSVRHPRAAPLLFVAAAAAVYALLARSHGELDQIGLLGLPRAAAGFLLGLAIERARPSVARVPASMLSLVQVAAFVVAAGVLLLPVPDVLIVPPFALLVASTADDRGAGAALAGSSLGRYLGERSYSIYLVHIPLLLTLEQVLIRTGPSIATPVGRLVLIACAFPLILRVSHLSYRWLETPARERLRRLFALRRSPIEASAPAP